jgi:Uma2 family endonuclease
MSEDDRPQEGAEAPQTRQQLLVDGLEGLRTPMGFRAELVGGEITVTPLPGGDHEHCVSALVNQLARRSDTAMDLSGRKGLHMHGAGQEVCCRAVPDLTAAPAELSLFREAAGWMPTDGVALVAEVTADRPDHDRHAKRHAYARGGIPLYLLVDRERGSVTLFSDPKGEDYRDAVTHPFGKEMPLPSPFSFDLDTSRFA